MTVFHISEDQTPPWTIWETVWSLQTIQEEAPLQVRTFNSCDRKLLAPIFLFFFYVLPRPIWTLTEIASTVSFVFKECTAYRFLLTILNLGELLIFKVIFHFETNMYPQVWIGLNIRTLKHLKNSCWTFHSSLYFTAGCLGKVRE